MELQRHILVIEDDPNVQNVIRESLADSGSHIVCAANGSDGLAESRRTRFDLIILDLSLPGLNGFDVCRAIREGDRLVPILMLTSRAEELDKVLGLELGADDYVTKPFGTRELAARCRALLRRAERGRVSDTDDAPSGDVIEVGGIRIDLASRLATVGGRNIVLTATEFDLLALFASNPGRTFSREEILAKVWGYDCANYGASVTVLLSRLRAKIESDPDRPFYIVTIRRVGYRFATLEEIAAAGLD